MWRGPIRVRRDKNNVPIFGNQDVQDFGCVVIKTNANPDIPPMLSVSGGATPKECAQFEITTEEGQYQFKELYVFHSFLTVRAFSSSPPFYRTTGKLMARHGHWFYVDGEPGTKAANTIFLVRSYVDNWNGVTREAVLVPYDLQSREIHAQYMSGDLNVKNSGFKMYVNLA
ncbi:hypothetical protein M413DRAFT_257047 [Hebeloma cylindrosporum]|uniref:Uncharacterized protein n=1 Tax=Hebeloma cylindrosporum TaxID=76867 RepID=A0A0C2Y917_HEBCY|nr:hypothetical protein M413DRAFT_257047 [Hebeloma cylindrosporum h7]